MKQRQARQLLNLASVSLLAASVLVCVLALRPVEHADITARRAATPSLITELDVDSGAKSAHPPLASFEPLWHLDLQRELRDAPLIDRQEVTPPPIRLSGTLVDATTTMGVFVTSGGRQEIKGIGQIVEGAEVLSIDSDGATIRFQGQTFELAKAQGGGGT